MILIAYDGSQDAKAALEQAGKLFPGSQATVLTVWQRFVDTIARVGGGMGVIIDYDDIDKEAAGAAKKTAEEGAEVAKAAGFDAVARTAVVDSTVADSILCEADAVNAEAVICGSRGLTGVKSVMLGSVSHHLLQHAQLPVVVVPSPGVAQARAKHIKSLR